MPADFFQTLGVARRFHLDLAELERSFHERSKLHHPDRHAKADSATRVKSALAATELNQAYRTLKSPIPRAEYLLKLEGIEITDEKTGHKVSPAFLVEILELREGLMDAKAEGDLDQVRALAADVEHRHDRVLLDLAEAFSRWEGGDREALRQAADALVAERYFRRFLEEVEAFEEAQLQQ